MFLILPFPLCPHPSSRFPLPCLYRRICPFASYFIASRPKLILETLAYGWLGTVDRRYPAYLLDLITPPPPPISSASLPCFCPPICHLYTFLSSLIFFIPVELSYSLFVFSFFMVVAFLLYFYLFPAFLFIVFPFVSFRFSLVFVVPFLYLL
jgi:hypothetical protein